MKETCLHFEPFQRCTKPCRECEALQEEWEAEREELDQTCYCGQPESQHTVYIEHSFKVMGT